MPYLKIKSIALFVCAFVVLLKRWRSSEYICTSVICLWGLSMTVRQCTYQYAIPDIFILQNLHSRHSSSVVKGNWLRTGRRAGCYFSLHLNIYNGSEIRSAMMTTIVLSPKVKADWLFLLVLRSEHRWSFPPMISTPCCNGVSAQGIRSRDAVALYLIHSIQMR
jgi:hypothetical protein